MKPERRFAFRLALALEQPNPDAMLAEIPWRVWQEWIQFYNEEPFGQIPMRLGFAAASLAGLLGERKNKLPWKASDFMPDVDYDPGDGGQPQRHYAGKSPDEQAAGFLLFAQQMGIKVVDKRGEKKGQRA